MPEPDPFLADHTALRRELGQMRLAIAAALDELTVHERRDNGERSPAIVNAIEILEAALRGVYE